MNTAKPVPCLILMHSFGGGAENLALLLARRMDPQRVRASLACVRHIPALAHAAADLTLSMPPGPGFFAAMRHMARIWQLARASDAVLGSLELQSIFWAALLAPGRSVAWLHKDIEGYLAQKKRPYAMLYTTLLGWALRRCRAVACVSEGIRASTARLWPDLRPRLQSIWNPLDIPALRERAKSPLQAALVPCFTRPVILAVGRLEQQKAFHRLLEAHALLRQQGMDHHLCILGEGSERARLEADARRLHVDASVFMPGFMDPAPAMAQASVLALSSTFEGLPTVIMEALALGLPVVASDCPSGPRELLEYGKYGLLPPVGDAAALCGALRQTLDHPVCSADELRQRALSFDMPAALAAWEALLGNAGEHPPGEGV